MDAEQQLDELIDSFTPQIAERTRQALARLAARVPGATRLVYDNFNTLTIAFSPSDRAADTVFMLAAYPRWLNLCFLKGVDLPDPDRLLFGNGRLARNLRLHSAEDLDTAPVLALLGSAMAKADVPMRTTHSPRLIIKSIGAQRRPRRPE